MFGNRFTITSTIQEADLEAQVHTRFGPVRKHNGVLFDITEIHFHKERVSLVYESNTHCSLLSESTIEIDRSGVDRPKLRLLRVLRFAWSH